MSWINADALKARVVAWRQMSGLDAGANVNWVQVCADANEWGKNAVVAALVSRGYTAAQAEAWDRAEEFSVSISMFWALTMGMVGQAYDRAAIDEFDRREELLDVEVLIDEEVPEVPEPDPDENRGIAFGMLTNVNDVFGMDDKV